MMVSFCNSLFSSTMFWFMMNIEHKIQTKHKNIIFIGWECIPYDDGNRKDARSA